MAVPRDYTPDNFLGGTAPVQGSAQAPQVAGGGEGGGNALLQGSVSRTSGTFGRSAAVKAGEDIRAALESLKSAGGGTLILLAGVHRPDYDIVGDSKINIVGEGIDQTVIDFGGGSYQIVYDDTDSFFISNLTVKDSIDAAGVRLNSCFNFSVYNVKVDGCGAAGFLIQSSSGYIIENCGSSNNTAHGFIIESNNSSISPSGFVFFNCSAESNTGDGFKLYDTTGISTNIIRFKFIGCNSLSNTNYAYNISGARGGLFSGCSAGLSGDIDFQVAGENINFMGCIVDVLNDSAFNVTGEYINITSCIFYGAPNDDVIVIGADYVNVTSCLFDGNSANEAISHGTYKVHLSENHNGSNKTIEVVNSQYTVVGNVGTGEDDLMSYSLPGGTLGIDGEVVRVKAWGEVANNANSKTVKVHFGSQELAVFALPTGSNVDWSIDVILTRTGAATQKAVTKLFTSGGLGVVNDIASRTLSSAQVIKLTGTATSNNDITQDGMIVEVLNQ